MITKEILDKLIPLTEEESKVLRGKGVDKSIYTTSGGNIIRSKKLLVDGKIISVRKHTRFIHFPKHTHDYIEAVYMCSGKTTHIINGEEISFKQNPVNLYVYTSDTPIIPDDEKEEEPEEISSTPEL